MGGSPARSATRRILSRWEATVISSPTTRQPGAFLEFNRHGRMLYKYGPSSGPGELNRPSLVELLPSGVFMANDDYNDRMVAIDPATAALVWQYGRTGTPGTARVCSTPRTASTYSARTGPSRLTPLQADPLP